VGNAGIVQVLTAQRLQQLSQLGLVHVRADRYADTVKLFLASGGGLEVSAQPCGGPDLEVSLLVQAEDPDAFLALVLRETGRQVTRCEGW
jgi:hypothetical protein